jgi:hypothetical protein
MIVRRTMRMERMARMTMMAVRKSIEFLHDCEEDNEDERMARMTMMAVRIVQ